MRGRIAVLKQYLTPMEIQEYDVPDPEPGGMVVRIRLAGVCGSDLHTWRGDHGYRPLPASGRPMGHEGMGHIYALGHGVTTDALGTPLQEGDRVVFPAVYSCRRCLHCLNGDHNLCSQMQLYVRTEAGQHPYFVSTFADFLWLPPDHPVFKVPDELADAVVVSVNCALGTVYHGLTQAGLRPGQSVVFQGVGGLGLYGVALARDMGAACMVAIDGQETRLKLALEMGATAVIDINRFRTPEERREEVMRLTQQRGADIVLELVGLGELVQEGINMLGPGGAFVEIGNLMRDRLATISPASLLRGKRIIGSGMYRPSAIPALLQFLQRNHRAVPLHSVISHTFPLASIDEAFLQAEWKDRRTPVVRAVIAP